MRGAQLFDVGEEVTEVGALESGLGWALGGVRGERGVRGMVRLGHAGRKFVEGVFVVGGYYDAMGWEEMQICRAVC